ncbi:MAG: SagB/ThcOx family dehydrogenase, partial [Candidatus Thermoplasmatota archaeon]|nr:SagB/ThcOx family dehydrogenase [Candidatus Thermoplasmatota archaeon]
QGLGFYSKPSLYKTYPDSEKILLEKPQILSKSTLFDMLKKRKSIRDFSDKPLSMIQLSYLLWASTGMQRKEYGYEFRTAPSAGALYPIETYLVVNKVENINPGVYHYAIKEHILEKLKSGDFSIDVARAALDQFMCAKAAVVFVWSAVFNRSKCKYGQRAYRYIYLDAGHIAQNLALASTSLELGCCHIGAFYDDEVNKIIGVDGNNESVIYMSVVGNIL